MAGAKRDTKRIVVDLKRQVLFAYLNGSKVFSFDCVSGDADHPTPRGTFYVLRKQHPCFSLEYKVWMNYALFFTNRGHAIHMAYAVGLLSTLKSIGFGYFGSHGCVRLSESNARSLFGWADVGTEIFVGPTLSVVKKA